MLYYFGSAFDENSETDLTLFRHAFSDNKTMLTFGNYRAEHGLEAAMPLFKHVTYHWEDGAVNPIGDFMGGFLFSVRAGQLI